MNQKATPPGSSPSAVEGIALAAYLLAFVIVAPWFTSHGPQHADAVMDAEPSINMVLGRGAVSFTHPQVPPGSILALVAPLYTAALAAWLGLWGISCRAVMSFNAVVIACASLCVWLFVARWALIRSIPLRLLTVMSVPIIPPVALIYSTNRYDSLGMLGLAAACASLTCERRSLRLLLLTLCGVLVGTGGFHVIIGGTLLGFLALAVRGRTSAAEFLAFGAGTAVGLTGTIGIVVGTGALESLRGALTQNAVGARRNLGWYLVSPLRGGQRSGMLDADLLLMSACVCAVIGAVRSRRLPGVRSGAVFSVVCGLCIPLVLSAVGRYSGTYVWLAAIPMLVGAMIAVDREIALGWWRLGVGAMLALTAFAGFPADAAKAAAEWTARDRAPVESFILAHLEPDDVVYTTFVGYYPVKLKARVGYFGSAYSSMSADQRAAVSLVIIGGKENGTAMYEPTAEEAIASFGGEWTEIGKLFIPRGTFRMSIPLRPKSDCTYNVTIYRRKNVRNAASACSPQQVR